MNKENIIGLKREITNKWVETKDPVLDEVLNVLDYLIHELEEKDKLIELLNIQLKEVREGFSKLQTFLENKIKVCDYSIDLFRKQKPSIFIATEIAHIEDFITMYREIIDFVNGSGKDEVN